VDATELQASARARTASRRRAIEAMYATGVWLLAHERVLDAARIFRKLLLAVPSDERGWLGLGECHERIEQPRIAAELYGAGSAVAGAGGPKSVRCLLARARVLARLGLDAERELEAAERWADAQDDEELSRLVAGERRRLS
jgi:hypothetical protein